MRLSLACLALAFCLVSGSAAAQNISVTISPTTSPALGRVVYATSANTTFSISTTGAVTVSGPAKRLTAGGVTPVSIAILCSTGQCNSRQIEVTITSTLPAGATLPRFTLFRVSAAPTCSPSCSVSYVGGAPTPASPLTFRVTPPGNNKTVSFGLGSDVTVGNTGPTGPKTFTYQVTATLLP